MVVMVMVIVVVVENRGTSEKMGNQWEIIEVTR